MSFADNLNQMPPVDHLAAIAIKDAQGQELDRIENKPGKQGSLKLYHFLQQEFGELNKAAAEKGLELFAEHVADASANPGKHPNIDRLFEVIESGGSLLLELIEA